MRKFSVPFILRTIREQAGINQPVFARALGMLTSRYQRAESGYVTITKESLQLFCDNTGIQLSQLMGLVNTCNSNYKQVDSSLIAKLPKEYGVHLPHPVYNQVLASCIELSKTVKKELTVV